MLTTFETWLISNKRLLSREAFLLFEDSLKCYKADIIRPAFLLAYQGMLLTIRDTVNKGSIPNGFKSQEWENWIKKINAESAWDDVIFNLINKEENNASVPPKVAPLCMPENVRKRFTYWRDLRNRCAHYKSEPFINAHVLTLYSFIEYWLLKISVTGGVNQMLERISKYCDPAQTSANTPWESVVKLIPQYIRDEELAEFITQSLRIIANSHYRKGIVFIHELIHNFKETPTYVRDGTLKWINKYNKVKERYILYYPDDVLLLLESEDIRSFWYKMCEYCNPKAILAICILIKANKLSPNDIDEFIERWLKFAYKRDSDAMGYDPVAIDILKENGYFDKFFEKYMAEKYINTMPEAREVGDKTTFYLSHLSQITLNPDKIRRLIEGLYNSPTYPYKLRNSFESDIIKDNQSLEFWKNLIKIAQENEIHMPNAWEPLNKE